MPDRRVTLAAPPAFHLPPLDDVGQAWTVGEEVRQRLESVYWDTVDLRLARWGASLRHRSDEGWAVRTPDPDGVREPLILEGAGRRPPDRALGLVRGLARRAPLQPMARLSTRRRSVPLCDEDGTTLLTVVDDEVSVLQARRVAARFRELVVVAPEEQTALVDVVVARLGSAGAAPMDPVPYHIRALGPLASVPEIPLPTLSETPAAAEVVTASIATQVSTFVQRDPGVRLGGNPEDVHQARVSLRRLRSNLRTFSVLLDPEWAAQVREEAGWLAGELGGVRDREVLLERLETEIEGLEPQDQRPAHGLTERLEADLEEARAEMRAAFDSERYLNVLELLIEAARRPRLTEAASAPAAGVLPALVRGPWRKLRRAVQSLPDDSPPDAVLHRLRILAKRARYAAEAAVPVAGAPAALFAKRAAALQTVLGEHQDSVVARGWLRAAAGTGRRAFVAGLLYGIEHSKGRQAREEWTAAWDRLSARKLRSWMTG